MSTVEHAREVCECAILLIHVGLLCYCPGSLCPARIMNTGVAYTVWELEEVLATLSLMPRHLSCVHRHASQAATPSTTYWL